MASVNIGCQPSGVVDHSGRRSTLYVASCLTDTVNVYDARRWPPVRRFRSETFPENLAITPDGRWVYVTNTIPTTCR